MTDAASSYRPSPTRERYPGTFWPNGQVLIHFALTRPSQTPASHRFSSIWSSYSWRKYLRVERTGLGAVCPRPHKADSIMNSDNSSSSSRSFNSPCPSVILSKISSMRPVPSLQGVHFPHDSSLQNSMKNRATSTMHLLSSMTIKPPEPTMAPSRMIDS